MKRYLKIQLKDIESLRFDPIELPFEEPIITFSGNYLIVYQKGNTIITPINLDRILKMQFEEIEE